MYCSVQADWCQAIATEFQRHSGVKVSLTQNGSGEVLAQVTAEAANPKGDVLLSAGSIVTLTLADHGISLIRP